MNIIKASELETISRRGQMVHKRLIRENLFLINDVGINLRLHPYIGFGTRRCTYITVFGNKIITAYHHQPYLVVVWD
jgi:hypothetical protein